MCIFCVVFVVWMSSFTLYLNNEKELQYIYPIKESINTPNTLIASSDKRFFAENPEEIQELYPNVPFQFLREKKISRMESCETFPKREDSFYKDNSYTSIFGMAFSNQYWQVYTTKYFTLYLYNAYLDHRESKKFGSAIRIIGYTNGSVMEQSHSETIRCLIWYDVFEDPELSDILIERNYFGGTPTGMEDYYLFTCNIPHSLGGRVPQAVSIIENDPTRVTCLKPSNYLKVFYNPGAKKDVAVCVVGLSFIQESWTKRLIEWIELLSILGADKIFFYELEVHPDISRVLTYYLEKGIVDLTKITLPGNQPNKIFEQHGFLILTLLNTKYF